MKGQFQKPLLCTLFILASLLIAPHQALSHSGRTDSLGGHRDNKNKSGLGSYHYHCGGYPAHLHANGACPYTTTTTDIPTARSTPDAITLYLTATKEPSSTKAPNISKALMPAGAFSDDKDIFDWNDWRLLYIVIGGLTSGIIGISLSRYVQRKVSVNVKEQVEKKELAIRQQFYSNLFSRHTPRELAVVPSSIHFTKDRLPIEVSISGEEYGKFKVYTSDHGNCFHKKCGCSNAYVVSHLFIEMQKRLPCSKCVSENTYEYSGIPKWYTEYLEYSMLQEKFASSTNQIK